MWGAFFNVSRKIHALNFKMSMFVCVYVGQMEGTQHKHSTNDEEREEERER